LEDGKADIEVTVDELVALLPDVTDYDYYYGGYYTRNNTRSSLRSRYVAVSANVTEAATGTVLSGNNTAVCTDQKYNLTFLAITPSSFKPGLSVSAYVRLPTTARNKLEATQRWSAICRV